jgi:cation/acetate symporter
LAAPALAVLVKFEVMSHLVGQNIESLPAWMAQWARVDASLLSINDVNGDRVLQFSELKLGADLVMLATPELGGLPYVVSGLVAAGGLAAALSTADGLLLTIGNALTRDLFIQPNKDNQKNKASAMRQVMVSKFALLLVALIAAYVAAQKSADILYLVTASFSLAGAAFVPVMVLGIFWRKTSRVGAMAGMLTGVGVTVFYMVINAASVRTAAGLDNGGLWFGIQPVSAGVFGILAGFVVTVLLSLLTVAGRQVSSEGQSRL